MVLELHVWGPAFLLPSIDPRCLAAIAWFAQAVPEGEWVLVASSDVALSPTNELPALKNGNLWIGGFANIVDYVEKLSGGRWTLDSDLGAQGRADSIAFSSYLGINGQPLLDLSLYVSSQNYSAATRPTYSSLLPFPLAYTLPPSLRSAAKSRSAHLGLSSLDIDTSQDDSSSQNESLIPASLRRPKATVSSLLSETPEIAARVRLDALATDFFQPLQALRGNKRYFLAGTPTTFDCLALGYLSLMLFPDVPQAWLSSNMREKFSRLCAFVHTMQADCFGDFKPSDAFVVSEGADSAEMAKEMRLPWKAPERPTAMQLGKTFGEGVLDHVPFYAQFRQNSQFRKEMERSNARNEGEEEKEQALREAGLYRRDLWLNVASVVVAVGAFVGATVWWGVLGKGAWDLGWGLGRKSEVKVEETEKATRNGSGLGEFGEAGGMLDALLTDRTL